MPSAEDLEHVAPSDDVAFVTDPKSIALASTDPGPWRYFLTVIAAILLCTVGGIPRANGSIGEVRAFETQNSDKLLVARVDPLRVLSPPERAFVNTVSQQHPEWRRSLLRVVTIIAAGNRRHRYVAHVAASLKKGDRIRIETKWQFLWQRVVGASATTQTALSLRAVDRIVLSIR